MAHVPTAEARLSDEPWQWLGQDVRGVLADAEGMKQAQGVRKIHMEHLLAALHRSGDGEVRQRFNLSENQLIERLAATTDFRQVDSSPAALEHVPLDLSGHAREAVEGVVARGRSVGRAANIRDFFEALLAVPNCRAIRAFPELWRSGARRPNLEVLSDDSVERDEDDCLGMGVYADALALLIDNPRTKTPLTIAISAPWGAGKSSLARLVQSRLESKPAASGSSPHVTCWFNAWLHDSAPDLAGAFASEVARTADRHRSFWRRVLNPLPVSMAPRGDRVRLWIGRLALWVLPAAALAYLLQDSSLATLLPDNVSDLLQGDYKEPKGYALVVAAWLLLQHVLNAAKTLGTFVNDPKAAAGDGTMNEVREQLTGLIHQGTPAGSRFVIFIDDLERCTPPRSVDVLEVVNQLLSNANVVTVLIADLPAVAACVNLKYDKLSTRYAPDLGRTGDVGDPSPSYGWLYLQKIIQLRFDLPLYHREQMDSLVETIRNPLPRKPSAVRASRARRVGATLKALLWGTWPDDCRALGAVHQSSRIPPWPARLVLVPLSFLLLPIHAVRSLVERIVYPCERRVNVPMSRRILRFASAIRHVTIFVVCLSWLAAIPTVSTATFDRFAWPNPYYWRWPTLADDIGAWRQLAEVWITWALSLWPVLLPLAAIAIHAELRKRHDRRWLEETRDATDRKIAQGDQPVADGSDVLSQLVRERLALQLVNESEVLNEAQTSAMPFATPLPRNVKRLLNELRLQLFIADRRQMFGGSPELKPVHVGKWSVLRQRWPELARVFASQPSSVGRLEDKTTCDTEFQAVAPSLMHDQDARAFFSSAPSLGNVAERLVRCEPATKPEKVASAA